MAGFRGVPTAEEKARIKRRRAMIDNRPEADQRSGSISQVISRATAPIRAANELGQRVRAAAGKAIKPGTGALAKRRGEVIESQVNAATRKKRKR